MRDRVTFAAGLSSIFRELLGGVNTAFPGVVQAFDGSGAADVQPAILVERPGEQPKPGPMLLNVPVLFPGGGGFRLAFPLREGDEVLVICSQRSLDRWKATGGVVEAGDRRQFALSDAVAIPGLIAPGVSEPVGDAAILEGPAASVTMALDGGLELLNGGGQITMSAAGVIEMNGHLKVLP